MSFLQYVSLRMTNMPRRYLLLLAVAAGVLACTKKEERRTAVPAAPAASNAVESLKPEPLKAAWVYAGPVADAGSTFAHDQGRKSVEAEFGDRVQTTFVESLPDGAKAEGTIRNLAAKGNKIIFATGIGYVEPMLKIAAEFPDVKFEYASGHKTTENMRPYDPRSFEAAYIAGVIAGKMTKSNLLGFVGSIPVPEVLLSINAFALGAQSVNPKVKTEVAWVNTSFDPPRESEAAQSLISGGADVLLQNTDSTAVLQTAEKNGKYAFGWSSDMSAFAPKAHLASLVVDWGPYYKRSSQQVMDGSWTPDQTIRGDRGSQMVIVNIAHFVPADVKERVEQISAGLKSGTFATYTGPVVDGTGKLRLAVGAVANQDWLDKMDFYVKGVVVKVPPSRRNNASKSTE